MAAVNEPVLATVEVAVPTGRKWIARVAVAAVIIGVLESFVALLVLGLTRFGYLPAPLFFLHELRGLFVSGKVVGGLPIEFWWLNGFAVCLLALGPRQHGVRPARVAALYGLSAGGVLFIGETALQAKGRCWGADVALGAALVLFVVASAFPVPSMLGACRSLLAAGRNYVVSAGLRRRVASVGWLAGIALCAHFWKAGESRITNQEASDANLLRWYEARVAKAERRHDKIQVIAFTDYLCPYCAHDLPVASALVRDANRDQAHRVSMEVRDFPLDGACNRFIGRSVHPLACEAAAAVRIANSEKGTSAAIEMTDWLYQTSRNFSAEVLRAHLAETGLLDDFTLHRGQLLAAVSSDVAAGFAQGVRVTPTFIINGVQVPGGIRALRVIVNAELARAR